MFIQVGIRLRYTIRTIREFDLESNVKIYYPAKVFVTLFLLLVAHILMELMNLVILLALKKAIDFGTEHHLDSLRKDPKIYTLWRVAVAFYICSIAVKVFMMFDVKRNSCYSSSSYRQI